MKAMVLCAGMGSRLGELTRERPKPLLEASGHPLLSYILNNLKAHAFSDIVINLHYGGDLIRNTFGSGARHGIRLHYSEESSLMGTAGGVKLAAAHFQNEDSFLVHYGDIITDENLSAMVRQHRKNNALVTLLVHHRRKSNSAIVFDENLRVQEFHERPPESFWERTDSAWVNSGVMLISPEVLSYIPESTHADWPKDVFPHLLPTGRMFAYPLSSYRVAVDSPERLNQLQTDIRSMKFTGQPLGVLP